MAKIIAHVDMDCFFASIEEKHNPKLKEHPLVIGGLPQEKRGVVSTANYQARKFGIKSAMPISKAYSLCPSAIFMKPNKNQYVEESKKVMSVLKKFSDILVQVSIDEAYLDITEFSKNYSSLNEVAKLIKKEVLKYCRLPCSIGISNSSVISKIASAHNKPLGTTIVFNPKEFLSNLPINKIPGIGFKTNQILKKNNLIYIKDITKHDVFYLKQFFGSNAYKFRQIAMGQHITNKLKDNKKDKSISKEHTFEEDVELNICYDYISEIANNIFENLHNRCYKTISIKIRYSDFKTITRNSSLIVPMKDYNTIINETENLLKDIDFDKPIRLFGIKISNFCDNANFQKKLESFI